MRDSVIEAHTENLKGQLDIDITSESLVIHMQRHDVFGD